MMRERERTNLLFAVTAGVLVMLWYSNEKRRSYVDKELLEHGKAISGAEQRAAGRLGIGRALIGVAAVLIAVPVVLQLVGVKFA